MGISLDPLARERPAIEGLERGWPGKSLRPVTVVEHRPEFLEIEVAAEERGLLVLSDTWSAGWRAWVDGTERRVHRVGGYFRGVVLQEGDALVTFRYQPWSWRVGVLLSLMGLALLSAWQWVRSRSARVLLQ